MILFKEDISNQHVYIDYTTQNKSFVKLSEIYRRMGVENNTFMLSLYNRDLIGVDPYNPNISAKEAAMVAHECKINYWYYIRELLRVPAQGGQGVKYEANRANIALSWMYLNSIDSYIVLPRQIGKTITTMGIYAWLLYIAGYNTTYGLFARGNKLVIENVRRLKNIRDSLPKYMISKSPQDTENKEGLSYVALGTSYKTYVSQKDKQAASDQGRGESFSGEHFDEFSYYTNNHLSYPAATSASDAAMMQARARGIPAAIIITTTAGELDEPRGQYAFDMAKSAMEFSEQLFDLPNRTELIKCLKTNSDIQMCYMEFSHTQLGRDEEWFKWVTRGKAKKEIDKDYRNVWVRGSSSQVLSEDIVEILKHHRREPSHTELFRSLILRWYIPLAEKQSADFTKRTLILGSDTSDNVGKDYTTLVLLDASTLEVVMTCKCNQTNLAYVAECIIKLLLQYPNILFIPERNKNGGMLIDIILKDTANISSFDPFKRIYNTIVQELENDSNSRKYRERNFRDGSVRKQFGFNTTSAQSSRPLLYGSVLTSLMEYGASRIYDKILSAELMGLSVRNGRVDHANDGNDDMVIALLLTGFIVFYGKNLDKYGIDVSKLLSQVDSTGNAIEESTKLRQAKYRLEYDKTLQLLESCDNPMLKMTYSTKLKKLQRVMDDTAYEIKARNIDQPSNISQQKTLTMSDAVLDNSVSGLLGSLMRGV